jgi:hypothetical protein
VQGKPSCRHAARPQIREGMRPSAYRFGHGFAALLGESDVSCWVKCAGQEIGPEEGGPKAGPDDVCI